MIAIILGSHGKFCEDILKSTEMILGKQENVATITYMPGEGSDILIKKYEDVIKSLKCKAGVLFMVDLFGGSPFNAASRIAAKEENMDIITGINISMLLGVFSNRENSTLDELAKVAISAGHHGIKSLKEILKNSKKNEK